MDRLIVDPDRIHPVAREKVGKSHREVVETCRRAVGEHDVVVLGMAQNPHVRRARRALEKQGIACEYVEYGSYLGEWRRRTALKMWTGWPTFPMVFVKGNFIGGADELEALIASGELVERLRSAEA